MNRLHRSITVLLVLVMFFNSIGIALAQGPRTPISPGKTAPPSDGQVLSISDDSLSKVQRLAAKIQPFIQIEPDGSVNFMAPNAAALGLDDESYHVIRAFIDGINAGEIGIAAIVWKRSLQSYRGCSRSNRD